MIVTSLFAFLLFGHHGLQMPNTAVLPAQAAFYSAGGGTATVEMRDNFGRAIPLIDTNGGIWPNVTVTIPAATATSLGYLMSQTSPGAYALNPTSWTVPQTSFVIKMNCIAEESPVGTYDSSAGAGAGIAKGYVAPNATTPTVFASGNTYTVAPGSVISLTLSSGSTPISGTVNANTVPAGSVWALPPGGWTSTTDWTTGNGLPSSPKYLWMNLAPGTTATLKLDGGGQTGVPLLYVAGTLLQLPPGVTKIYAVGNGSTGAAIAFVVG